MVNCTKFFFLFFFITELNLITAFTIYENKHKLDKVNYKQSLTIGYCYSISETETLDSTIIITIDINFVVMFSKFQFMPSSSKHNN